MVQEVDMPITTGRLAVKARARAQRDAEAAAAVEALPAHLLAALGGVPGRYTAVYGTSMFQDRPAVALAKLRRLDEVEAVHAVQAEGAASRQLAPPPQQFEATPKLVTSWSAVAEAVGKSADTVKHRREAWGCEVKKPHFDTPKDAVKWWQLGEDGERGLAPTSAALRRHRPAATEAPRATTRPKYRPSSATTGTTPADLLAGKRGKW